MIDVSIEEALATMAIGELANAGLGGKSRPRRRVGDGNGATVTILPASDGYAAISPREDRQWAAWLEVMGSPDWGGEPRFATKPDRVANWDALHALMSEWSRQHPKQWIADQAQAAHVPSFPLREPAEQLASPQLAHRGFLSARSRSPGERSRRPARLSGLSIREGARRAAGPRGAGRCRFRAFACSISAGSSPARPRPAISRRWVPRSSRSRRPAAATPAAPRELHTVLGQAKRGIVLDLKQPEAVAIARALAAKSDVLVENFATGVMDRLGPRRGRAAGAQPRPDLRLGLGSRAAPGRRRTPSPTAPCCNAMPGSPGSIATPGIAPRVGFAWLDPMCGLMLAFVVAAGLWHRRRDRRRSPASISR